MDQTILSLSAVIVGAFTLSPGINRQWYFKTIKTAFEYIMLVLLIKVASPWWFLLMRLMLGRIYRFEKGGAKRKGSGCFI